LDFLKSVLAKEVFGVKVSELKLDTSESILAQGVNSAAAVLLRNALTTSLSLDLPVTLIYDFPFLQGIVAHVVEKIEHPDQIKDQLQQIREDLAELNKEVKLGHCLPLLPSSKAPLNVLLTGATGYFGSHFLAHLLRSTNDVIHCVVRASSESDAFTRIKGKMEEQLCWEERHAARIVAHVGDLSKPNLHLSEASLSALFASVGRIYHVGAQVNWILPYSQLRNANVIGTLELLKAIGKSGRLIPFHFVSTIAAISVGMDGGALTAEMGGYAQSKWVGEQMTQHAGAQGLPVASYRLPLVTPHSVSGASNSEDELTRTIRSCIDVKAVPILDKSKHTAPIQAVPVDVLAASLLHLSDKEDTFARSLLQSNTLKGPSWFDIFELLSEAQGLEKVPLSKWVQKIKSAPHTPIAAIVNVQEVQFLHGEQLGRDVVARAIGEKSVEDASWDISLEWINKVVAFISRFKYV